MKKNILVILIFLMLPIKSFALTYAGCDNSVISALKNAISNVNIYYEYYMEEDSPKFNVILTNILPNMYFKDTKSEKLYYYQDTDSGVIKITGYSGTAGSYKFYTYEDNCKDVYLGTKYYKFPTYNRYYNDPLCSDIPNYSLCQKWIKLNYDYDEFKNAIEKYKNKKEDNKEEIKVEYNKTLLDDILNFYVEYYYYFLSGIIIICLLIIINDRRKNRFKL